MRGQTTNSTLTVGNNSYPVATTYNDAGQPLTLTYPTGETVTAGYTAQGWLGSLNRTLSGTTTTLLDAITYTGSGGAAGQMTSGHLGNGTYTYSATFDALARPTDIKTARASDSATLFEEAPSYDAVGNISGETLTLPTGTDVQQFCYDEQNRLSWAGSVGTPPCTGATRRWSPMTGRWRSTPTAPTPGPTRGSCWRSSTTMRRRWSPDAYVCHSF